ncbi:Hypothetical predicted protein, partial [Olea europaea subsp. europaea]
MLSMWEMIGLQTPPMRWKSLLLTAHLDEVDTPGIFRLLLNSLSIETLILNRTCDGCSDEGYSAIPQSGADLIRDLVWIVPWLHYFLLDLTGPN